MGVPTAGYVGGARAMHTIAGVLAATLPNNMGPTVIRQVEALPFNGNGEVDRRALAQQLTVTASNRRE